MENRRRHREVRRTSARPNRCFLHSRPHPNRKRHCHPRLPIRRYRYQPFHFLCRPFLQCPRCLRSCCRPSLPRHLRRSQWWCSSCRPRPCCQRCSHRRRRRSWKGYRVNRRRRSPPESRGQQHKWRSRAYADYRIGSDACHSIPRDSIRPATIRFQRRSKLTSATKACAYRSSEKTSHRRKDLFLCLCSGQGPTCMACATLVA